MGGIDVHSIGRERKRHLAEALHNMDRFENALQSRRRSKGDSVAHDRSSHAGVGAGPRGVASAPSTKGGGRGAPYSGEGSGVQKGGEKSKNGIINKRMRTSLADARV